MTSCHGLRTRALSSETGNPALARARLQMTALAVVSSVKRACSVLLTRRRATRSWQDRCVQICPTRGLGHGSGRRVLVENQERERERVRTSVRTSRLRRRDGSLRLTLGFPKCGTTSLRFTPLHRFGVKVLVVCAFRRRGRPTEGLVEPSLVVRGGVLCVVVVRIGEVGAGSLWSGCTSNWAHGGHGERNEAGVEVGKRARRAGDDERTGARVFEGPGGAGERGCGRSFGTRHARSCSCASGDTGEMGATAWAESVKSSLLSSPSLSLYQALPPAS